MSSSIENQGYLEHLLRIYVCQYNKFLYLGKSSFERLIRRNHKKIPGSLLQMWSRKLSTMAVLFKILITKYPGDRKRLAKGDFSLESILDTVCDRS
jgi:hypothetical protein